MVSFWKYLRWLEILSVLGTSRDKHNQSSHPFSISLFNNGGKFKVFLQKHFH